jgi:hypothetical protein
MNQPSQSRSQLFRKLATLAAVSLSLTLVPVLLAQTPAPSLETLHKGFLNPPNEARPMVRWWWFGTAVVKPEILRELQQMKADGIQGAELAFEYPQVLDDPAKNLKNLPFLSPEMLDDVNYAQTEGRKLGLRIDVTLCSGWPYGGPATTLDQAIWHLRTAQVDVPANATSVNVPALQQGEVLISASIANSLPRAAAAEPAAAPVAPPAGAPAGPGGGPGAGPGGPGGRGGGRFGGGPQAPTWDLASAKPLTVSGNTASFDPSSKPRTALFFVASHTKMMVKRPAVGAEGYVLDAFSREAVATHLRAVGEPLLKAFGDTPPTSIFSDSLEAGSSDWTPKLPEEFQKRRGYDLIPHLAELVAGGTPAAETVRHDYGKTLTELVNENYLTQINDWAIAHHTKFRSQTYGDPAVNFSSQSLVGFAEGEGPQWRAFSTLRWATSANHVFGHEVTSGETFTWLHSPVFRATPLDMKAEADIDFIMGENLIFCHGWPYSPPDNEVPEPGWSLYAAASFNNHNPWHPVMPSVTAYIGRLSYLLRQGQPANQVAILLPTDDGWASFAPGRSSFTADMSRMITPALMSSILSAGYNIDYIDAEAIDKVGLGSHTIVVVPPTDRIPLQTLHKLAAFTAAGGKVISVGRAPSIDPEGKALPELVSLSKQLFDPAKSTFVPDDAGLAAALTKAVKPDFQLNGADPAAIGQVGFIRRKLPNADIYVVVNTANVPFDITANFTTTHKSGEEWDADTAESTPAQPNNQTIHLEPFDARVYVFSDAHPAAPAKPPVPPGRLNITTAWTVIFTGLNKTVDEPIRTDWIDDPSTIHYSGEAIYSRDLQMTPAAANSAVYIQVSGGKPLPPAARAGSGMHAYYDPPVHEAALVFLNGQYAGALWHPPYRVDVAKLIKPGINHIEIHVYNTALNAWSALPPHDYGPLIAKYGDRFQMQDLNQVVPISSGLLGTVEIVAVPR